MSVSSALGLAGNYFFGPIGGFIGSTIGTLLGPKPDDIENFGPRLGDRRVQVAGYGQSRPIVYGTMQLAGTVIEPQNFELTETVYVTEEGGGKGGGPTTTTTTYSYSATFASLLCEGPIIGVRKIWLDSVLVYDLSSSATAESITASNKAVAGIRIYTGSETQTADSVLESLNGAGNTPAYRGSAYIVFDALQLEKFGNRLPNVRAEVVATGSRSRAWVIREDVDHPSPYDGGVITSYDNGVYRLWDRVESAGNGEGTIHLIDANGNYLGSEIASLKATRLLGQDRYPVGRTGESPTIREVGVVGFGVDALHIYQTDLTQADGSDPIYLKGLHYDDAIGNTVIHDYWPDLPQDRKVIGASISADHKRILILMSDTTVANAYLLSNTGVWYLFNEFSEIVDNGTCDYTGVSGANASTFGWGNSAREHFSANMLESDYKTVWLAYSAGQKHVEYWQIDDAGEFALVYNQIFTISNLDSFDRLTIHADNSVCAVAGDYDSDPTKGYFVTISREELYTVTSATLSDIVDDIEDRVGVDSASRDNSALTDTVDGYMISRLTTARRSIEPLQTAFFFDAIETGYKIKSVNRGGASVATIALTDMGAIEYGSAPIFPLDKTRIQEIEIPKEIVCKYISPARGYEVATQRSRRIETLSSEKKNIDLPISMSDNKGKEVVEVLHFNFWAERNVYAFSLMPEYTYLDPADVITVTDGSDTYTIRITAINLSIGGVIQCEGVADSPAVYSSTSDGVDNDADDVTVTEIGPTKAVYGNWPMFTNQQNGESIYIAATGLLGGWNGGLAYRSIDNGANYSQVSTFTNASTIGFTTDALPDGDNSTFDYASTVNISLQSGTLSSATEIAVLNGTNAVMIGSELVQFMDATLESDGSYTLSTLLRGRKGTEWAMSDHSIGETLVLIDTTIKRPNATLNAQRQYKAVSIGNFIADATPENVTYTGVNLKPLSPTHLYGERDASDNLTIDWVRRSRFENAPLWTPIVGEDTESYEVDILSGSPLSVVRTISVTSETASYTAAQQTTDFGSAQPSISMKIYQISGTIGRGYEASATL